MYKGIGTIAYKGWGRGAKRHVYNIYVRGKISSVATDGCTLNCQNGGKCIGATCKCAEGYFGKECSIYTNDIKVYENQDMNMPKDIY